MITDNNILSIVAALAAEQTEALGPEPSNAPDLAVLLKDQALTSLNMEAPVLDRLMVVMHEMVSTSNLNTTHHAFISGLILGARISRANADNERLEVTA